MISFENFYGQNGLDLLKNKVISDFHDLICTSSNQ